MKSLFKVGVKDRLNATTNSKSVKDLEDGQILQAVNFAIGDTVDVDTGEEKEVTYIFTKGNGVYGATSATIRKTVQSLLEIADESAEEINGMFGPEGVCEVTVFKRKSAGGREFLQLEF